MQIVGNHEGGGSQREIVDVQPNRTTVGQAVVDVGRANSEAGRDT